MVHRPMSNATLCIGVDITWWGGQRRSRASQRDTIVAAIISPVADEELVIRAADLSQATNHLAAQRTEPNRDPHGEVFLRELSSVLDTYSGRYERCILALDAPLQCQRRSNQRVRKKCYAKGEKSEIVQRGADESIATAKAKQVAQLRIWNARLQVQPGSPIPVRIERILRKLSTDLEFTIFGEQRSPTSRQIIEIFPSEAIWSLGVLGHFGDANPADFRLYKQKGRLTVADAMQQASLPLNGFSSLLAPGHGIPSLPISAWIRQLATHACFPPPARGEVTHVRKGKAFDDPIDSGLAFLTAVSFALGCHHLHGAGTDGTIVGPGLMAVDAN